MPHITVRNISDDVYDRFRSDCAKRKRMTNREGLERAMALFHEETVKMVAAVAGDGKAVSEQE